MVRRLAKLVAVLVALALGVVGALALGVVALSEPRPTGMTGPAAEERARQMVASVGGEAWERTGAVRWTVFGHQHLWDRERHLARVAWWGQEVWIDLNSREGVVIRDGERLAGSARRRALDQAHAFWINDSFWLNPVVKAFDEGTTRSAVDEGGKQGVLVHYGSGGMTPGDAYLWWLDDTGRPTEWQLWVSVVPLGGARVSWEGWTELQTGAWVSTRHGFGPGAFEVVDVAGATTLAELEPGQDPFAVLYDDP